MSKHLFLYLGCRWLVGGLFLFSGLIKLNDLISFSLKIEAYLEGFSIDFSHFFRQLLPYTVPMGLSICLLEVILGTALLLRCYTHWVVGCLWVLTSFFTVLTLYTLWFKRVASCGCLSEAIALTPQQSFAKNLLLIVLLMIISHYGSLQAVIAPSATSIALLLGVVGWGSFLGWHSFTRLPLFDWGTYQVGASIPQLIQPSSPLQYRYWVKKDGYTNTTDSYPTDQGYQVLKTELLNPSAKPKVTNFTIWDREQDITNMILTGNKLLILVQRPLSLRADVERAWSKLLSDVYAGIDIVWLLPFHDEADQLPLTCSKPWIAWTHASLLQAILPTEMGCMWLQNGTIMGKWSYREVGRIRSVLSQQGFFSTPIQ